MAQTVIDLDDAALAFAALQLGTRTKRETITQALTVAVSISADDRARGLAWLQENADHILDFDILAQQERSGR